MKRAIQIAVPDSIRQEIGVYLQRRSKFGEQGWVNSPTSEDSLTGDFGGCLRSEWSDQREVEGYLWRWRVQYRKLGVGNQHASEEKATGGDGIFQIEVNRYRVSIAPVTTETASLENIELEQGFKKGILFQAKRYDSNDAKKLCEELTTIEQLTPGHGLYVEYSPNGYHVALGKQVLELEGKTSSIPTEDFHRIGEFFSDQFLECLVGVEGMYVDLDSTPQVLYLPDDSVVRKLGSRLSHALCVQVTGLKLVEYRKTK